MSNVKYYCSGNGSSGRVSGCVSVVSVVSVISVVIISVSSVIGVSGGITGSFSKRILFTRAVTSSRDNPPGLGDSTLITFSTVSFITLVIGRTISAGASCIRETMAILVPIEMPKVTGIT